MRSFIITLTVAFITFMSRFAAATNAHPGHGHPGEGVIRHYLAEPEHVFTTGLVLAAIAIGTVVAHWLGERAYGEREEG